MDLLPNNLGSAMQYGVNAPYNVFGDRSISNGSMLGEGYTTPNYTAAQPTSNNTGSALKTLGAGIGVASPIIGAGLGVAGFIADRNAQEKAQKAQEQELEKLGAMRAASQQRYIGELDSDAARRQMVMRGQVANTPAYQAMMSNLANQNTANNAIATDNMQKQGLGQNSGMSAAIASNNLSNIGSAATMGAANQMNAANKVYGGLNPSAMTTKPENLELARQQGFYNEAADYGGNLAPLFNLGSTATKGTIADMYRTQMKDDVNKGFAIGKSGGNV